MDDRPLCRVCQSFRENFAFAASNGLLFPEPFSKLEKHVGAATYQRPHLLKVCLVKILRADPSFQNRFPRNFGCFLTREAHRGCGAKNSYSDIGTTQLFFI